MSQNDFNLANQGFPQMRADMNSAFQALASNSSGATAPGTTYAYQFWYDTSTNLLKMRNAANNAFITLAAFDQSAGKWEIRSSVIQAVDSAGVVIKTDEGTTRVTVADNGNVTLTNDLVVTGTVQASNISPTGSMSNRNKIINGAMVIDQRNAGAAVTANGAFSADRFSVVNTTDGAFSAQQVSEAPSGFTKSLKVTTTTADATLTTAQNLHLNQPIEGFNVADLGWGTAAAQTITVSFWVRSSLTGTFGGSFRNNASDRSYPFTYSISAANTWEYKTVTVAGDTTGTWLADNGVGIRVSWGLGAGPDRSGTAGSWAAANYVSATGAVSLIGTLNATWQITGVQLEAGTVATPFEHRSYGQELALCQRYFQTQDLTFLSAPNINNTFLTTFPLKVEMRASPTATFDAIGNYQPGGGTGTPAATALTTTSIGQLNIGSGNTGFNAQMINSGCTARISAEL
jgi:hypothetical protein